MEDETIEDFFRIISKTRNSSEIIAQLQTHQIDVTSIRNRENLALLHIAAGYGRTNLASYLVKQKVDVNAQDINGQAPLHHACCHGHFRVSCELIKAGARVDIVDNQGWTPLYCAIARKVNSKAISPTYWNVIELLLESGADLYVKSRSGRSCFDRINNIIDRRKVQFLNILSRLKKCQDGEVEENDLQMLEQLTTNELVDYRITFCNDITPLHRAAGYNHLNVARIFIQKGANVNATDKFGRIPLHNAAIYGHVEMIELLVEKNSDINKQDSNGYSPLHVAADSNSTFSACFRLIELGANMNLRCHSGKLPYDLAKIDNVKEVLLPDSLQHELQVIPSTSDQAAVYIARPATTIHQHQEPACLSSSSKDDELLKFDSSSSNRLHSNTSHALKKEILEERDPKYQIVKRRMQETIMTHFGESSAIYSSYDIISIELIRHETVWTKYKLMCQRLEIDYGSNSKNEKLLFHGSSFIDKIEINGFDERHAHRNGMYGAGLYFAEHSSKSNQYTFGWNQGCREHKEISCYVCERKMIYAQVALGRSLITTDAMPECAHAPPGYSSVLGLPNPGKLRYPEHVIYNGDQAYPLFVIRYRIRP